VVDGFVVAGTSSGTLTTAGQIRNEPTKNYLFALNGKYDNGRLKIEGDAYYSKGTIDQTIQIITLQATTAVPGTFDFRNGPVPDLFLGTINATTGVRAPYDVTVFSNYNPATSGVRSNRLIGVLEEWTGRGDVSYKFDNDVTLYAGGRYTVLQARSNAYRSQVTPTRAEIQPYLRQVDSGFLDQIPGGFPRQFLSTAPTYDYVFNRAQAAQPDPKVPGGLLPNPARDYDLTEKTFGGYAMISAEDEIFGIPTKANGGVRIVSTDFSVDTLLQSGTTAAPVFTPVNDKSSYTNVLPSMNIVFNMTNEFLVRASASKTLQRAGIAELAPSLFVNTTNRTASGGNAQLKPPTATQFRPVVRILYRTQLADLGGDLLQGGQRLHRHQHHAGRVPGLRESGDHPLYATGQSSPRPK
jgi:iron complex outermembrane receptor protein